jgi:hypothetical protein
MWQTRLICTYVAATVPVEKAGDMNPLLESAKEIGLTDVEQNRVEQQTQIPAIETFDPEHPPIPDNGNASFERFMGTFGSPGRWAGR